MGKLKEIIGVILIVTLLIFLSFIAIKFYLWLFDTILSIFGISTKSYVVKLIVIAIVLIIVGIVVKGVKR